MEARGCLGLPWDGLGQPKHTSNPTPATTLRMVPRSHPDLRVGQSATRLVGIRTPRATASGGWQLCQDKGLAAPLQLRALLEQCLQRSPQKGPPKLTLAGAGCAPLHHHQTQMLSPLSKLQWFEPHLDQ